MLMALIYPALKKTSPLNNKFDEVLASCLTLHPSGGDIM